MKLNLSLTKLAHITGGTLHAADPSAVVQSFATDSRVIAPGDVFWALQGQQHDPSLRLPQSLHASHP